MAMTTTTGVSGLADATAALAPLHPRAAGVCQRGPSMSSAPVPWVASGRLRL